MWGYFHTYCRRGGNVTMQPSELTMLTWIYCINFTDIGWSLLLKEQFTWKSKIHIIPLICSAFYSSRLFWCELPSFWYCHRDVWHLLNITELVCTQLVGFKVPKTTLLWACNYFLSTELLQPYHRTLGSMQPLMAWQRGTHTLMVSCSAELCR